MTPRRILKRAAFGVCAVLAGPLAGLARAERAITGGEVLFVACADMLSLVAGPLGLVLRLAFYRLTIQRCSLDVSFNFGATINHPTAEIGRNVSIGGFASIGTATICDDVLIGSRVSIISGRHQHPTSASVGELHAVSPALERVRIGAHSWIGEGRPWQPMSESGASSRRAPLSCARWVTTS